MKPCKPVKNTLMKLNHTSKISYIISKNPINGIGINFISFEDTDEERVMHPKSDNIKIRI